MWLNALTTLEVGRCACKSSDVLVDSLSSSGMWPSLGPSGTLFEQANHGTALSQAHKSRDVVAPPL